MNLQTQILNLKSSYAWGLDLSGNETGAGGVGGLLFLQLHSTTLTTVNNSQPPQAPLAPAYDGNGNILAYLDCATAQTAARYEYDPFGKLLLKAEEARVAGRLHHQFSTKYCDVETGLSYYGFRYYSPELGRWLGRDPIQEKGGLNLYGMVGNDPVNRVDYLGLNPAAGVVVGVAVGEALVNLGASALIWGIVEYCMMADEKAEKRKCRKTGFFVGGAGFHCTYQCNGGPEFSIPEPTGGCLEEIDESEAPQWARPK